MNPRVGLVVSYAPLEVGWEQAPRLLEESRNRLSKLQLEMVAVESPVYDLATGAKAAEFLARMDVDVICWIAATWSYDHVPVDMVGKVPVPLIAWGLPGVETGSLCGSQQLISVLTELNHPRKFVFGKLDDEDVLHEVLEFAQAAAVVKRLKTARLGMMGHRTIGMTEVAFHEYDLREVLGPIVMYLSTDTLLKRRDEVTDAEAVVFWQKVRERASKCRVAEIDGLRSMKCYLALKRWIETDGLAGIAVGCYPDLMGEVCLACGLLAEENIVTSCEGDVNSLILTYMMHHIGQAPVHNTDLLDVNEVDRTSILSHCGNSAISLAGARDDVVLDSVRFMGKGVVSRYPARPGKVTMANLCGKKGSYRLTYCVGQAVKAEMVFPGIPVKVQLPCSIRAFLEQTADFGTGHHWMIGYGDMSGQLQTVCRFLGLKRLQIE
jgi:L-fucose isomerase-like protein